MRPASVNGSDRSTTALTMQKTAALAAMQTARVTIAVIVKPLFFTSSRAPYVRS